MTSMFTEGYTHLDDITALVDKGYHLSPTMDLNKDTKL
jgi:hypothetical protein